MCRLECCTSTPSLPAFETAYFFYALTLWLFYRNSAIQTEGCIHNWPRSWTRFLPVLHGAGHAPTCTMRPCRTAPSQSSVSGPLMGTLPQPVSYVLNEPPSCCNMHMLSAALQQSHDPMLGRPKKHGSSTTMQLAMRADDAPAFSISTPLHLRYQK